MFDLTRREIDDAIRDYLRDYGKAISDRSERNYMLASIETSKRYGFDLDRELLNQQTMAFAQKYTSLLEGEGASFINGKKVYWLADRETDVRTKISEIIQRGLDEGKYPGVREAERGTYPKDTIANDLHEYFNGEKSKASTVARTEIMRIQNIARLDRFEQFQIREVTVMDADGENPCEACKEANGQIWTVEYAREHELEHPNCVRSFAPIIPEIKGEPE